MQPDPSKKCPKCNEVKPLTMYYKQANQKDGRRVYCIECLLKVKKEVYWANKDKISEINKKWYEENKERKQQKNKEWKKNNVEKVRMQSRKDYMKNPEQSKKRSVQSNVRRRQLVGGQKLSFIHAEEIKRIYANRPKGYHVDHIIPLRGETVNGLRICSTSRHWRIQLREIN